MGLRSTTTFKIQRRASEGRAGGAGPMQGGPAAQDLEDPR